MLAKKFLKYQKLKRESVIHPLSKGKIIDEWVEDFLRNAPSKEQFKAIIDDSHISADTTYALWKIRP